jgi:hypothetical protein
MKIYIGCGLTHVPRKYFSDYTNFIHAVAKALQVEHNVKYALQDSDPQLAMKKPNERARLCYLWDRQMVENAELMIADVSFPSTGLGIEVQIAELKNTPLIICYRDWGSNRAEPIAYETPDHLQHQLQIGTGFASLMLLGLPNIFEVIQYQDTEEGILRVITAVSNLKRL